MKQSPRMLCWALLLIFLAGPVQSQQVVINEIMYHPSSQDAREEYIELFNAGTTNVNLAAWRLSGGIDFLFPSNTTIGAGKYLVIAANRPGFDDKYPGVTNVLGSWLSGTVTNVNGRLFTNYNSVLGNTRDSLALRNAAGLEIDSVTYADSGEWAVRRRSLDYSGYRGWTWYAEADGLGKSLELINAALPNEHGQNWGPSSTFEGTPGAANSIRSANVAPLILGAQHLPVIPRSTESVSVSARIIDEAALGVTAVLRWRVDGAGSFSGAAMLDNGNQGDGAAGDGIFGASLGILPNNTIIEYYIEASDGQGNSRTWPPPAFEAVDQGNGNLGQVANALFQVDDTTYTGTPPTYKVILTSAEYSQLASIFGDDNSFKNINAAMNATFISIDASGLSRHYRSGVRNRGHGSRSNNPHNYRVNFNSDDPWKGVTGFNLNARAVPAQVAGSTLAQRAGAAGNNSRFVQLRVNNNLNGPGGSPANGLYAGNEDIDSDWSDRQFPNDGGGNIYSVVRDLQPPSFDYRGEDAGAYMNTYFKQSNVSENDWRDIMGMLEVMGENQTGSFTLDAARRVINVEQWLTHLAVMNLFGNNESGINTGNNDDYYLYRGLNDPRFIFVFHDLDTVLGQGGAKSATDQNIFSATACCASGDFQGIANAMNSFMHHPQVEPLYYRTLQNLIDGPFSSAQFNASVDQIFADFPQLATAATSIKNYMNTRRSTIQGVINGLVPPATNAPLATLSGEPRSPTWRTNATLTVGGNGVTHYQWRLNNGAWSAETTVATPIFINALAHGSSNSVQVVGRNAGGIYQSQAAPTVSRSWIVNTSLPTVRLNEILARNDSAVNHSGTFPDIVELYNEGTSAVTLTGLRLTDDPASPGKFTFPATTLAAGTYLTLYADSMPTPGLHLGFTLSQNGDSLYLYDKVASGGALLDSVTFGLQAPNLSIGRLGITGDWNLSQPTFGATNVAQALGNPRSLKINEWLAASTPPTTEDYIELYNSDALPVAMGGMFLTDEPLGGPGLHRIANLSFVAGNGFGVFAADGAAGAGAEHLNFRLASEQGQIGLFANDLTMVDSLTYGPQRTDVSYGRCPNGAASQSAQTFASPGSGNSCATPPLPPQMVNLLPLASFWRYNENTNLDGVNWKAPAFNDAGWLSGQAQFGSGSTVTEPVRTTLTVVGGRITYYFRSTFTVAANASFTSLQLSNLIDDGAVFYINGNEVARYNIANGVVVTNGTQAASVSGAPVWTGPLAVNLTNIHAGLNTIAVEVHQSSTTSGDVFFGTRLDGLIVTNSPTSAGIVINEILANNATMLAVEGRTPDMIEFYNPSGNAVDLAGASLNDSEVNLPPRWIFPPGSIVPARGYFVVYADADLPVSATNTGFGLKANGGSLFLFKAAPNTNEIFDRVDYGLQTADFSIGRVPVGGPSWTLTLPTFGLTNVAASLGDPSTLKINEWMADPTSGDDWFEIYNPNPIPVALSNLRLTDNLGDPNAYRIPALSYAGVGSNAFQRFEADNPASPLGPEHVNFKLSKFIDSLYLVASNNATVIDAVTWTNAQDTGVSEGRLPDGATTIVRFPETPTPSDANYLPLTSVVVSEVLTHTDLPLEDAIELRNLTAASINIGGWYLSDDKDSLRKFRIPNDTLIPANGFVAFYENSFNNDSLGVPFSLNSANGDQVYLTQATNSAVTGLRAVAKFGPSENGVSFGRYVNSAGVVDYTALSELSFGTSVTAQSPTNQVNIFRTGQGASNAYPKVGAIVISEVMYHPPDIGTNDNVVEEFIELKNNSTASLPLYDPQFPTNGWRLRDAVNFNFTTAHTISAGGSLLVVSFDPLADPAARAQFEAKYGANLMLAGPYIGKLDNSADSVELVKPDPPQATGEVPYVLVEKLAYGDRSPWPTNADGYGMSLQRISQSGYANEPTNWLAAAPTPGPSGEMDSDGDGMPDAWEMANGFDKNSSADAVLDADGDGMTNVDEYRAGTDPRNAGSVLELSIRLDGTVVELRFTALADHAYTIQYCDVLPAGSLWQTLTVVPSQATTHTAVVMPDGYVTGGIRRFYRLRIP